MERGGATVVVKFANTEAERANRVTASTVTKYWVSSTKLESVKLILSRGELGFTGRLKK
jgi:hypothetical protein